MLLAAVGTGQREADLAGVQVAMTLIPVVLPVLLAQTLSAPGGPARYEVTIEMRGGVWGSATETDGSCPKAAPGSDTLTGFVHGIEPPLRNGPPCRKASCLTDSDKNDEGIVYKGLLSRKTSVDLCEVRTTNDGDEWCVGHFSGEGTFEVTIVVPLQWRDNENLRIELHPKVVARAVAIGACSTLDNAAVEARYRSGDSINFETSDELGARVPGTGRLFPGTVTYQTRTPPRLPGGEYTLKVTRAP